MNDRYGNNIGVLCKVCGDRASGENYYFRKILNLNFKDIISFLLDQENIMVFHPATAVEVFSNEVFEGI
jgi:hypothetical protein